MSHGYAARMAYDGGGGTVAETVTVEAVRVRYVVRQAAPGARLAWEVWALWSDGASRFCDRTSTRELAAQRVAGWYASARANGVPYDLAQPVAPVAGKVER